MKGNNTMNNLKIGAVYTAKNHRTGTSTAGDWELLTLCDENGKNPISVFVDNQPSGIGEDLQFRIQKVNTLSFGKRKDSNGDWFPNCNVHAIIEPVTAMKETRKKA